MIDWGVIVSQVPSIAVALLFAWFTLKIVKDQREYLEKRDELFTNELNKLSGQIGAMNDLLISHDERMKADAGKN